MWQWANAGRARHESPAIQAGGGFAESVDDAEQSTPHRKWTENYRLSRADKENFLLPIKQFNKKEIANLTSAMSATAWQATAEITAEPAASPGEGSADWQGNDCPALSDQAALKRLLRSRPARSM